MTTNLNPQEKEESFKIARIKSHLAEILNPEIIDHVIEKEKRPLKVYWGTATTGRPHCGYLVPMMKVAELLSAGCHVKILLADIHAYLDNMKAPMELVHYRTQYYEKVIKSLLGALGVKVDDNNTSTYTTTTTTKIANTNTTNISSSNSSSCSRSKSDNDKSKDDNDKSGHLEFIRGSSYQLTPEYTMDRFKLEGITRISIAQKAGAEVVKQTDDPTIGGLIYPLMQALDEQYLDVDVQFGGVDQRKIFTFALENLPKIGYRIRAHLMNPMVPGLGEATKMSASDADSKIDVLDPPNRVELKLKKAKCVPREVESNGVVAFVEHVIFRALALKSPDHNPRFMVYRKDGDEPLVYTSIEKLKEDFAADILTPQLLKTALARHLNEILQPIRADYESDTEWQKIESYAYPVISTVKKVKKPRDKGDPEKRAAALARKSQEPEQAISQNEEYDNSTTPVETGPGAN